MYTQLVVDKISFFGLQFVWLRNKQQQNVITALGNKNHYIASRVITQYIIPNRLLLPSGNLFMKNDWNPATAKKYLWCLLALICAFTWFTLDQ